MNQRTFKPYFQNKGFLSLFLFLSLLLTCFYFFSFSRKAWVAVDIHTNVSTNFKIYWAAGSETYAENRSSWVRINDEQTRYHLPIGNLSRIGKLRIDPADISRKTAAILIKSINISQVGYRPIFIPGYLIHSRINPISGIMETSKRKNGLLVVSANNDPQLELRLKPDQSRSLLRFMIPIAASLLALLLALSWASSNQEDYSYIRYLLCFVLALVVSVANTSSVNRHPDEHVHLRASRYYEDHWRPPEICAPEVKKTYSIYGVSRLNSMEIVYPIAGKFSSALSFLPIESYLRLRMFNVLLFFLIVLLCIRSAEFCIIATPLLLTPQIWYVFSYFNSDAFALFYTFMLAYQTLVPGSRLNRYLAGSNISGTITWGIVFGAFFLVALLLKKNFYFFVLFFGLYWLWRLYFQVIKGGQPVKPVIQKLGLIVLVVILGYGFRYSLDTYYHGSDKKLKLAACQEKLAIPLYKPSTKLEKQHPYMHLRDKGVTIKEMIFKYKWFEKSIRSGVGVYGYLTISGPTIYYRIVYAIMGVGLIILFFYSLFRTPNPERILFFVFLICSTSLLGVHLMRNWEIMLQAQGRHFLPIVGMLGILFYHVRKYIHPPVAHLYVLLMFLLSAYSFIFVGLVNIPKG